jgi:ABC-2 type transport system ATP-binding protein
MNAPAIEFKNVTKAYRKHFWTPLITAVRDISFTVHKNTVTGFVGPNGAGKTTSIKMMLGLARPTKGQILINGISPVEPKSRQKVSFLSERPYFYEHLTVEETLLFAAKLQSIGEATIDKMITESLQAVELSDHRNASVKNLSKGMQQRLAMAQALVSDADLFILDEPMSGMDPLGRRLFRTLFAELGKKGKTVFFSSHVLDDVEYLCSHVIVLSQGAVQYQGEISSLLSQGFAGTDCIVPNLPKQYRDHFISLGCSVTDKPDNSINIFVPSSGDIRSCQEYLAKNGFFFTSLERRNASLEEVIYNKNKSK